MGVKGLTWVRYSEVLLKTMQISRMLSLQSCPASVPGTPHHPDWPALEGGRIAKLNWCPGGLNVTPGFSVSIEVFIRSVDGVHFCHPWDTKFSVWHEKHAAYIRILVRNQLLSLLLLGCYWGWIFCWDFQWLFQYISILYYFIDGVWIR